MKNRKSFLAALGISGMTFAFAGRAEAEPSADPSRSPVPVSGASTNPSPHPSATAKRPSDSALAFALGMRRFDAKLSDAEIETIARGVDENKNAGASLNPKKKRLRNGDEPVTTFTVPFA